MLVRCVENMPCSYVVMCFKESCPVGQCSEKNWWKCTMRRRLVGMQCNAELVLCNVGTRHVLQCRTRGAVQPAMPPVGGGTA